MALLLWLALACDLNTYYPQPYTGPLPGDTGRDTGRDTGNDTGDQIGGDGVPCTTPSDAVVSLSLTNLSGRTLDAFTRAADCDEAYFQTYADQMEVDVAVADHTTFVFRDGGSLHAWITVEGDTSYTLEPL